MKNILILYYLLCYSYLIRLTSIAHQLGKIIRTIFVKAEKANTNADSQQVQPQFKAVTTEGTPDTPLSSIEPSRSIIISIMSPPPFFSYNLCGHVCVLKF
jgi:hypothetical protein